jgi:hypothetical protein
MSYGPGGMLHQELTTPGYRSLEAFASSTEYPQRPAEFSHTDKRGAYQRTGKPGSNLSLAASPAINQSLPCLNSKALCHSAKNVSGVK